MMPFLVGVVSGKLFDNGHFHFVEISGALIFTFSYVLNWMRYWGANLVALAVYSCCRWRSPTNIIRYGVHIFLLRPCIDSYSDLPEVGPSYYR
jgi:hypothetical protein